MRARAHLAKKNLWCRAGGASDSVPRPVASPALPSSLLLGSVGCPCACGRRTWPWHRLAARRRVLRRAPALRRASTTVCVRVHSGCSRRGQPHTQQMLVASGTTWQQSYSPCTGSQGPLVRHIEPGFNSCLLGGRSYGSNWIGAQWAPHTSTVKMWAALQVSTALIYFQNSCPGSSFLEFRLCPRRN